MAESAQLYISENRLSLVGVLDFTNAMAIYKQSLPLFTSSHHDVVIDLAGLMSANSIILAMLVNWIRMADKSNKKLRLDNLSREIESLLIASRLNQLFEPHMTR